MAKFTPEELATLANEATAVAKINQNFEAIADALEITLSRDGTAPNEMDDDLDMNSFRITNLPIATTPTEPVRKQEFDGILATAITGLDAAVDAAEAAAVAADASADEAAASAAAAAVSAGLADTSADEAAASAALAESWANLSVAVVVSDTAPTPVGDHNLWYDTVSGQLFVSYDDGDSEQWVATTTQFPTHEHDDRYYTETEVDTLLAGYVTDAEVYTIAQVDSALALKANIASPTFTGTVTSEGNIEAPRIRLSATGDASLASATHAFQIGDSATANLIIDANEIMARSNGAAATLNLNPEGGNVVVGSGDLILGGSIDGPSNFTVGNGLGEEIEFNDTDARINLKLLGQLHAWLDPGELGIGTAWAAKFSSTSNFYTKGGGMEVYFPTGGTTSNLYLGYSDVGGTATLVYRCMTDGDVINTNNSYGAISDVKYKEDIVESNSQWEDIKKLRVRKYKLKNTGDVHIGVVAQELEEDGMNGLVSVDSDGDKSVAYSVLYMKAVKALQEAMTRIEQLEARVDALENEKVK